MKRILIIAAAVWAILSCGQNPEKRDIAMIGDFYEHVLGNKPMTDEYLRQTLSEEVLNSLWEMDYDDTYSYWRFRTGYQDGPSDTSSVESVEPLGEGWYRVSYSDMGNAGVTDIKVMDGKICEYKFRRGEEDSTPMDAISDYMRGIGASYAPAQYCIPYASIVSMDDSDPEDIKVWGNFWVENYNLEGETLKFVSGGSHPGLVHVCKADDGYIVTSFDAVGDGASFEPTAKEIFGDLYEPFMHLVSHDQPKKADREKALADFVASKGIPARYYQDFGWDAVEIPQD